MPETLPRQAFPIWDALSKTQQAVLITHHKPDGDAIGALLGLHLFCRQMGLNTCPIVPSACPDYLQWMPGTDLLLDAEAAPERAAKALEDADLLVCLDFSQWARTHHMENQLAHFHGNTVVIDHHLQPAGVFQLAYWDANACATAQLVFEWIQECGKKETINPSIAELLYTGILTDSGGFRFSSVTPATHQATASLIECGARPQEVYEKLFNRNRPERLRFMGYCMAEKMVILESFPGAYMAIAQQDVDRFQLQDGDTEGLVNQPLSIIGIQFSAVLREDTSEGLIKLSLRSKGAIPVNELADRFFEGGGHKNAAGGRIKMPLAEAETYFRKALQQFFNL